MLALVLALPAYTALTYNVLYDGGDVDKTVALIERAGADVVCLQEVTPPFAKRIQQLGYPHTAVEARAGTWGVALLSKHPLRKRELFAQQPHKMPALQADVALPDGTLRVACVHWFPPGAQRFKGDTLVDTMTKNALLREQQARSLIKRLSTWTGPALILGDLNEGRDDAGVRQLLDDDWSHSCAAAGARCQPTWPGATSPLPAVVEIDHVLGKRVSFREAHVLKDGGSDHHAVTTTFTLAPPTAPARP